MWKKWYTTSKQMCILYAAHSTAQCRTVAKKSMWKMKSNKEKVKTKANGTQWQQLFLCICNAFCVRHGVAIQASSNYCHHFCFSWIYPMAINCCVCTKIINEWICNYNVFILSTTAATVAAAGWQPNTPHLFFLLFYKTLVDLIHCLSLFSPLFSRSLSITSSIPSHSHFIW